MQEKTVKESSITSSHLMLMEHAGNFLFNKNGVSWNIIIELIIRILSAKLKLKPIVSFSLIPGVFANKKLISKIKR